MLSSFKNNKFKTNKSGFTLVELLVVVAIIGVLASAGIPSYRRMVSKAKQAEAKVGLATVLLGERALQAEYGTYGNHLRAMGVDMNDGNAGGIYLTGFITTACASAAYSPATVTGLPTYGTPVTSITEVAIGNTNLTNLTAVECGDLNTVTSTPASAAGAFLAVAVGRVNNLTPSKDTSDIWTVTQTGTLANFQQGIQ